MWLLIEERLPEHPLAAETVLHVRRHLRALVHRRTKDAPHALAMLLGEPWDAGESEPWRAAAETESPLQAGARLVAARENHSSASVALGHDNAHVEACRQWLSRRVRAESAFDCILADDLGTLLALSSAMDLTAAMQHDGRTYLPVLIQGETGTGKELLAEAIHNYWKQQTDATGDFHIMQVAGITSGQIYAELFGAAKGAYTGLTKDRKGRVEIADGGTLLVDEVGDLPAEAQVALLRFLQTGRFQRLGESTERSVAVRIIAATWHDLDESVAQHRFRLDLLHRIRGGGAVSLPPLRERSPFDVVIDQLFERRGRSPHMSRGARDALRLYSWPGNLRELVNAIDTMVAFAHDGEAFRLEHLPTYLQRAYIALPLSMRAPGIICDVGDGGALTSELVALRVDSLSKKFFAAAQVQPSELVVLHNLLEQLVDVSEENVVAQQCVARAVEFDTQKRQWEVVDRTWAQVLARHSLPAEVARELQRVMRETSAARRAAEKAARLELANPSVTNNTWLAMLQDLQHSPLLKTASPGEITSVMIFLHNILAQFAPQLPREIALGYREDKFRGVIRRAIDKLEQFESKHYAIDTNEIDPSDDDEFPELPKEWTREHWQEIAQLPTLKEAKDASGFDPKTIYRYLEEHEIVPAWKKSH